MVSENWTVFDNFQKIHKIEKFINQSKAKCLNFVIKIFQNKTNIGPVRNWKRCIDESVGEYGKILWSDDLIAPKFLEETVLFLDSRDVGFVFTNAEIFSSQAKMVSNLYSFKSTGLYDSDEYIEGVLFKSGFPASPGCALFRLKDLKKNLIIDIPNKVHSDFSTHAIGNDLLIFLLTGIQYKKFAYVNKELSFFRAHKESISIQSKEGKLPLHYNLAASYFVENYRKELITKMNVRIWVGIQQYKETAKKFNLHKVEKYYLNNYNTRLNYAYLLSKVYKKLTNFWAAKR